MKEFDTLIARIIKTQQALPSQIAVIAVNFSKERFRQQNWLDEAPEPWKPRKRRREGGEKRSQSLLVDTGKLKRSIRKIKATPDLVVVGTDVPYAKIHNDGGKIEQTVQVKKHQRRTHQRTRDGRKEIVNEQTVKTHSRKMNTTIPARRFLGDSDALMKDIEKHVVSAFEKAISGK